MAAEVTLAALRQGDEEAFVALVDRWYGSTVRLARVLSHDRELAKRAARDAWLRTIDELPTLEDGPVHVTLLAATLERAAARVEAGEARPVVDAVSFEAEGNRWEGWWREEAMPRPWSEPAPDEVVVRALERLPPPSAAVVLLRDVEGLPPEEVQATTGLEPAAQRVLLHQGRAAIWQELGPKGGAA